MPELPEVQTTVNGLAKHVIGLSITDAWSDYKSPFFIGAENIKDPAYFAHFRKQIIGQKIVGATRRAKNILIRLSGGGTILVHLKMTGHMLYGIYRFDKAIRKHPWIPVSPESIKDPFSRFIHLIFTLSDGKYLALSDSRKFAKVVLIPSGEPELSDHFKDHGPEPLEPSFTFEKFQERLILRPTGKIKPVLLDQTIISGVGNIYGDESLWRAGIHPLERVKNIPPAKLRLLFKAVQQTLRKGIDFGGDSTSDYRNILGERGAFHETHRAYQKTGEKCSKPGCGGTIRRIVIGSRSAHFCDRHQKLAKKS